MPSSFDNDRRSIGKSGATSITTSQRSTCNLVFYRWNQTDITKLNELNAGKEKILQGNRSAEGNLFTRERVIIRNDVIRCKVDKNKSSNSGTFSVTLKRGKEIIDGKIQKQDINYLDVIHPGDWIMIYIKKSGTIDINSTAKDSGLKMIGIVENVRYVEIDDENSGSPRLEYIVTGRDFGKVFDMNIFFNPLLNQEVASTLLGAKFLSDSTSSIKGNDRPPTAANVEDFSPDNVVKKLTSFYLGGNKGLDALNPSNQAWYIPKDLAIRFQPQLKNRYSTTFVDILDLSKIGLHRYAKGKLRSVDKLPGATLIKSLPSSGTVWSVLEFLQNSVANEMYTELVDDGNGNLKPCLVLRQVPFSNRRGETNAFTQASNFGTALAELPRDSNKTFFVELPKYEINSSDIKSKNVGKSDFERINHAIVIPKIDDTNNLDKGYNAAINYASIQRYGLKTYQARTQYTLSRGLGDPVRSCKYFLHLLIDWFFLAHQLFNGTIVVDGNNNHVELGTNLYIADLGQLYHIEGYGHEYKVFKDGATEFTTAFTVSRGQSFRNNQAKFIGPSDTSREPTTITTSVLEGVR